MAKARVSTAVVRSRGNGGGVYDGGTVAGTGMSARKARKPRSPR